MYVSVCLAIPSAFLRRDCVGAWHSLPPMFCPVRVSVCVILFCGDCLARHSPSGGWTHHPDVCLCVGWRVDVKKSPGCVSCALDCG